MKQFPCLICGTPLVPWEEVGPEVPDPVENFLECVPTRYLVPRDEAIRWGLQQERAYFCRPCQMTYTFVPDFGTEGSQPEEVD